MVNSFENILSNYIMILREYKKGNHTYTLNDVINAHRAVVNYTSGTSSNTNNNLNLNVSTNKSNTSIDKYKIKQSMELTNNFSFSGSTKNNFKENFLYITRSEDVNGKFYLQNEYSYPYNKSTSSTSNISGNPLRFSDKYTFQMQPWDLNNDTKVLSQERLAHPEYLNSVSKNLQEFRSSVGILTHGDNDIARTMKYFMYNRWKVPDSNLLFHKTMTYIFFTRPDLNLLASTNTGAKIIDSLANNTEVTMIYQRYPELFKLLTDKTRCNDRDNFNMLLSNQLTSFDMSDETIETIEAGKSWSEYTMPYGGSYTGRTAGTFNCSFKETSDLSVINLLKLWLTYIDNVARGAWRPCYNLSNPNGMPSTKELNSHIYTRTLDYAASAYLFICDQSGEEILYWTKYYGIYPTSTGSSALNWNGDNSASNSQPTLSIPFRYAWKKDMSPISLIEFNNNADIYNDKYDTPYEVSYDGFAAGGGRPFVRTPYIEIDRVNPSDIEVPGGNLGIMGKKRTHLRLKFRPSEFNDSSPLRDANLYSYLKYSDSVHTSGIIQSRLV